MSGERRRVFLSYRRTDTQHVAGRAADKLADRFELFMDVDTIPPGVDFADYLTRAVGGCDVLLAFIGEHWAEATDESGQRRLDDPNDWVVGEIATALDRDIPVIPVLVDGASLPAADQLPQRLQRLTRRQLTRLRFESFSADLAHLVAAIEHVGRSEPPPQSAGTEAASDAAEVFADRWDQAPVHRDRTPVALAVPVRRRRLAPIIGGVALAVAIAGVTWAVLGRGAVPAAGPSPSATIPGTRPTTPVPSAPPVPPATTVAQLKLRVPAPIRPSCRKLVPSDRVLARDLIVALQCAPLKSGDGPRPRYAFYFQYSDSTAAQAAFRDYYASGPPAPGDCTLEAGEVPDDRGDGDPLGVLRCYRDTDGYGVFAWISPEQSIVASAADRDLTFAELSTWWSAAGPTAEERVGE